MEYEWNVSANNFYYLFPVRCNETQTGTLDRVRGLTHPSGSTMHICKMEDMQYFPGSGSTTHVPLEAVR